MTASLTALLSDIQHYLCKDSGSLHLSWPQGLVVIINFVLQGLIAWRAFIDDTPEKTDKESEVPVFLNENIKK